MKQTFVVTALIGIATLLSGCDKISNRFDIVRAGNQTFVLNKSTGEAKEIQGTVLLPIKEVEAVPNDEVSKQAKNWPAREIPQLGNIKPTVKTKYRDGQMLYSVEATPYTGTLENEYNLAKSDYIRQPTIYIDFSDADGFSIGIPIELKVRGGGATRVVNEKGEAYALAWTGAQSMTVGTYKAAVSQSVRWAGFAKE